MTFSLAAGRMARMSGLRSIMEDVATTVASSSDGSWINLSIGNPALIPEVVSTWRQLTEKTLASSFTEVSCQYGPSRGTAVLIDAIVEYFNSKYGWPLTEKNVVVGPGSQMLCFAAATLFAGPQADSFNPIVLPTIPDYTGYAGICTHDDGVVGIPGVVVGNDRRFRYHLDVEAVRKPLNTGMFLLSSPCNPTGRCISLPELETLIACAVEHDTVLVIDNAYGEPFPKVARSTVTPPWNANVVNLFTISKAGLPGDRVGFAIGPEEHISAMVSLMSNAVLHAPQLPQFVLARALREHDIDRLASSVIQPYYERKRQIAEELLSELLPDSIDWRLHETHGGMFCWIWINHPWFDDMSLYYRAKEKKVFIVPGSHFFVNPLGATDDQHSRRCFRISISADESLIAEGLKRVAKALTEMRHGD